MIANDVAEQLALSLRYARGRVETLDHELGVARAQNSGLAEQVLKLESMLRAQDSEHKAAVRRCAEAERLLLWVANAFRPRTKDERDVVKEAKEFAERVVPF